ncbi:sigma-70 family RNA polymerase sigma factor [Amaricoccus sp.]|uniref:sigma-70 family RNA polymerase sigma factor n=1 Tax=Amaricoccus sp. TaxID=1872485 RepID=UPI001B5E470D|nr:sigma-70 family RNA polymerase sigma factor [Amaricoccus sp.]MBP7003277.1 sigma-70 family RNA polymerase sigma factor [Amaricoccus sp.]
MAAESEPLSDDELIRRYALGDAVAARMLVERHAPRLLARARRMLGDAAEAEDVTQEAMLRLWRGAAAWRPGEAGAGTWLYRVASNLCLDRLRRRRPTGALPDDAPDGRPAATAALARADRAAALDAALAELPERQRTAIVLRHIEERGNPEIAEALGVSVEAVESLLARGRRALTARLAPRREELELDDGDV